MDEIKFTAAEWQTANDLAVSLLKSLGPQSIAKCEHCGDAQILLPNYAFKYALAEALRANGQLTQ